MYISLLLAVFMQSTSGMWILLGFHVNRYYIENQLCNNRFDLIPLCKGYCYLEEKVKEENKNNDVQIKVKLLEVAMVLPEIFATRNHTNLQPTDRLFFSDYVDTTLAEGFSFAILKPPILSA